MITVSFPDADDNNKIVVYTDDQIFHLPFDGEGPIYLPDGNLICTGIINGQLTTEPYQLGYSLLSICSDELFDHIWPQIPKDNIVMVCVGCIDRDFSKIGYLYSKIPIKSRSSFTRRLLEEMIKFPSTRYETICKLLSFVVQDIESISFNHPIERIRLFRILSMIDSKYNTEITEFDDYQEYCPSYFDQN